MDKYDSLSEESISILVDTFYEKVRKDPLLADIFNTIIKNWDAHLIKLKKFWISIMLKQDVYKGNPFMTHMGLLPEENK